MKGEIFFLILLPLCIERSISSTNINSPNKGGNDDLSQSNHTSHNATQKENISYEAQQQPTISNVIKKMTDFELSLYRTIAKKHDENIIICPFGIFFTFASLMMGTKGSTYREILQALNLHLFNTTDKPHALPSIFRMLQDSITKNEDLVLEQGSVSFVHEDFPVKDSFLNVSLQYFDMEFSNLDFQNSPKAKEVINNYIKNKTKGMIPKLFDEIDPQTKFILANYILFNGKWIYPFNPAFTELDTFYISKYSNVKVPMMFKTDKISSIFDKNLRCWVVKLPYRGNASMMVIMPQENDLASIEDHLSTELIDEWLANMKLSKMDVYFPKFKLDQKYKMKKCLQDLGIKEIFSGKGNLSGLTDERNLRLSQVTQRVMIEVDEKGTEAVAVTGAEITAYSMPDTFRADHPFIFIITEDPSKTLLFIGRINDPTKP
uniref:Protein Z-dependent protease inhibitor n=1 Tax=Geotrypetes seraphini TaxID=260995 RepID=A0A6P8RMU5_GEOSA|nr:protein Z-dependent protease inhibitor [Geotrypetes seraphini]XP_033806654.1 protein Z-dependent protease inhibitor [Geotrypetes seraphini]